METTRVVLIGSDAKVRGDVRSLLEGTPDIEVVGEGADGPEGVVLARRHAPDVVVRDMGTAALGPTEVEELSALARVVVLTDTEAPVAGAIKAGAAGYLVHGHFEPEELFRAVREVGAGQSVVTPAVVNMVFEALREGPSHRGEDQSPGPLTAREREIMDLLVRGTANKDIAKELFISEKTVKNHINHIYAKLRAGSRAEAIVVWRNVTSSH